MPIDTPKSQQRRIEGLRAKIVSAGEDFRAAKKEAERLAKMHQMRLISDVADPLNSAGIGNIGVELGRQTDLTNTYAVFVPAANKELIAGVDLYLRCIAPKVKIIGVALSGAEAVIPLSAHCDRASVTDSASSIKSTVHDESTMPIQCMIDEVVQVSVAEVSIAIQDCFEERHSLVKQTGATGLAGAKAFAEQRPEEVRGQKLIAIMSEGVTAYDEIPAILSNTAESRLI